MDNEKLVTSTEKLLDVIRGNSDDLTQESPSLYSGPGKIKKKRVAGRRKGISVGVDIGYTEIRLVKISEKDGGAWNLLDYRQVPFEKGIERGTESFTAFLRAHMAKFCGSAKSVNIYAMMSTANVEVRNISVPKVGKKELRKSVLWKAKQETPFNEEDTFFDFEVQGEIVEKGIVKLGVLYYTAPKKEVSDIKTLFDKTGFPLDGLTVAPLALQNIFRTNWIPASEKTVSALYIGRNWSRIDIFSRGNLVMTRGIKAGIKSMVESLVEVYEERRRERMSVRPSTGMNSLSADSSDMLYSNESSEGMAGSTLRPVEDVAMDMDQARRLIAALSPDAPPEEQLYGKFALDREAVFEMVMPALERLARQVERTFEHYSMTLGRESIPSVYVSMAMDVYTPIVDYIGGQLGIGSDILDPLAPDHAFVAGSVEGRSVSERLVIAPVLGVALSHKFGSLDLLHRSEDSEKRKRQRKVSMAATGGVLLLILLAFVYYLNLEGVVRERERTIAALDKQLSQNIQVDEAKIIKMVSEVKKEREKVEDFKKHYSQVVIFGEISKLTPEPVKLFSVKSEQGEENGEKKKPRQGKENAAEKKTVTRLIIEGVVSGAAETLEGNLAGYVLTLQSSPIFNKALVKEKKPEKRGDKDQLRFTVMAQLAEQL